MFALPIHRRVDNFCFPFRPIQNDYQIFFAQTMLLHEQSESPRVRGSFCHEDKSACFAVDSIHYLNIAAIVDLKAIIDLTKKNDLSVFEMEKDGFRLRLQKGLGDQPIVTSTTGPAAANGPGATASAERASTKDIVSPMVGTFFRAASPDASPFVDVGAKVDEDTVCCIIEAIKVMNEMKEETR